VRSPCVTRAIRRTRSPARATEPGAGRQTVIKTADRQPILESDQKHQAKLTVLSAASGVADQLRINPSRHTPCRIGAVEAGTGARGSCPRPRRAAGCVIRQSCAVPQHHRSWRRPCAGPNNDRSCSGTPVAHPCRYAGDPLGLSRRSPWAGREAERSHRRVQGSLCCEVVRAGG